MEHHQQQMYKTTSLVFARHKGITRLVSSFCSTKHISEPNTPHIYTRNTQRIHHMCNVCLVMHCYVLIKSVLQPSSDPLPQTHTHPTTHTHSHHHMSNIYFRRDTLRCVFIFRVFLFCVALWFVSNWPSFSSLHCFFPPTLINAL